MDSKGQKAGKGPLIAEEISNTLGTSQDQYLFQPIVLESHPNDSRVKIDDSGSIQTLTSSMGTGGGNVPMVMMPYSKSRRAKSADDFETWKESRVSNTINTFDQGDVRATDVVVLATQRPNAEVMINKCPTLTASAGMGGTWKPVICIQGNVIDRSDNAGANGAGWRLNQCYTLNTIDRPAVVYPKKTGPLMANSHPGSYSGQDAYQDMFVVEKCYSLDEKMGQTYIHEDKANTLAARDFKQPQIVVMSERAMSMVTGERVANTLAATDYKGVQILAIDRAAFNQGENAKYDFQIDGGGTAQTLIARGPGAVCYRKPVRK